MLTCPIYVIWLLDLVSVEIQFITLATLHLRVIDTSQLLPDSVFLLLMIHVCIVRALHVCILAHIYAWARALNTGPWLHCSGRFSTVSQVGLEAKSQQRGSNGWDFLMVRRPIETVSLQDTIFSSSVQVHIVCV